jgi:hypothetical protein
MEPGLALLILTIARIIVPLVVILAIGTLVERHSHTPRRHA